MAQPAPDLDPGLPLGLHPKQHYALASPATEIMFGGAKGGGKSHLMRVAACYWASCIPGLQAYLFRRISPDLWRNHMTGPGSLPTLLGNWMRLGWASFNGGRNYWEFHNGSRIHLCHCQYDSDMHNYQGAEMHLLLIDQLEQWSLEVYQFLRGQVRLGGLRLPGWAVGLFPRILSSANPGGVGHTWVKQEFVDISPPLAISRMAKARGGMLRQYIPSYLEDNPTMAQTDPEYEGRLEGMGTREMVKALRWGIWDIVAGSALGDLWDPAVHVLEPFPIPRNWRVERSLDWGFSRPFSVGWWAHADGTTVYVGQNPDGSPRGLTFAPGTRIRVAEWYGWSGKADEGCRMLPAEVARRVLDIERDLRLTVRPGPADASIYDSDVSHADDMARVGVRWTPADKRPGSREAGLKQLRAMLKAATVRPMEEPGLFVFDTCRHFIRTMPNLPLDPKRIDDVDTKAEDHIYDETRYQVMTPARTMVAEQGVY